MGNQRKLGFAKRRTASQLKTLKKILFWAVIVFVAIQLIPVDRTNEPVDKKNNFVDIYNAPPEIRTILKNACYDCHSNETNYPKYAYVAPISWAVKDHINEGKDHLNFSVWGTYNKDIKSNAVEKSIQTIENYQMPLPSYIQYHPKSNLTKRQRQELANYFRTIDIY